MIIVGVCISLIYVVDVCMVLLMVLLFGAFGAAAVVVAVVVCSYIGVFFAFHTLKWIEFSIGRNTVQLCITVVAQNGLGVYIRREPFVLVAVVTQQDNKTNTDTSNLLCVVLLICHRLTCITGTASHVWGG